MKDTRDIPEDSEAPSHHMGYRWWLLYVFSGVIFLLAYFLLPLSEGVQVILFTTLGLINAAVIFAGVRIHRPRHPLIWHLFAISYLAATFGNVVEVAYVVFSGNIPLPSLADVPFIGGYAMLIVAGLTLIRIRNPWSDRASLVDSAIVATGAFMLVWVFLISPSIEGFAYSSIERFFLAVYPLLDILLLAIVVHLMVASGYRSTAYWMLILALLAALLSDISYGTVVLLGSYEPGSLVEAGWMAAHFLGGASALHPSMVTVAEPTQRRPVEHSRKRLAVLGAVLLLGPFILTIQAAMGDRVDVALIVVGSVVLLLLIVVRVEDILSTLGNTLEELRKSDEDLRNSEQHLKALVGSVPVVLFTLSRDGLFTLSEGRSFETMGLEQQEIIGQSIFDLYGETPEVSESIQHALAGERVSLVIESGGSAFESWYAPLRGAEGEVTGVIGVAVDVTERKALEQQLLHQAFHDSLTNLPNRTLFMDRLERSLRQTSRQPVALLFMDLDNFKIVNDSLGHEAGDQLLVAVSERLRSYLDPTDMAARLGGDEFAILLGEAKDEKSVTETAEKLAEVLREPFVLGGPGREIFVAASMGITVGHSREQTPEELLRRADLAMYKAKETGKARHEIFDSGLDIQAHERLSMENDLRGAIEKEELKIFYQPKVRLDTGEIAGMEALVRWQHPERGLIMPGDFVPLAEETGLIFVLERWIMQEVCRQTREWQERNHEKVVPTKVSVNVSAKQFRHSTLVSEVAEILESTGLSPETLVLELTETAAMEDTNTTIRTLQDLKRLGVKLALDDFGKGYSSLSYLKNFPVDFIKIDRTLIEGMELESSNRAIVSATITLAHALNLEVVAEGVESAEQVRALSSLGCDLGQGYYWWVPVPGEEAINILEDEIS